MVSAKFALDPCQLSLLLILGLISLLQTPTLEVLCLHVLGLLGGLIFLRSQDLFLAFIGLELMGFASYTLLSADMGELQAEAATRLLLQNSLVSYAFILATGLMASPALEFHLSSFTGPVSAAAALISVVALFKIGAVPLHNYVPDTYTAAPWSASTPTMLAVILKWVSGIWFLALVNIYPRYLLALIGILSLIVGCVRGLVQSVWMRLIAYSSISHAGWVILAGVSGSLYAYPANYLLQYLLTTLTLIYAGCVFLSDLHSLLLHQPALTYSVLVALLSSAGVPPFPGFFTKLAVLLSLVSSGWLLVPLAAVALSFASVFYYVRLIQLAFLTHLSPYKLLTTRPFIRHHTLKLGALLWLSLSYVTVAQGWEALTLTCP